MARSNWKGPISIKPKKSKRWIKTFSKNSRIMPNFLNLTFEIYNGFKFIKLLITDDMINYKLGEFIPTRKPFSFKKKKYGSKNKF